MSTSHVCCAKCDVPLGSSYGYDKGGSPVCRDCLADSRLSEEKLDKCSCEDFSPAYFAGDDRLRCQRCFKPANVVLTKVDPHTTYASQSVVEGYVPYEYDVVDICEDDRTAFVMKLCGLGQDGWEVFHLHNLTWTVADEKTKFFAASVFMRRPSK